MQTFKSIHQIYFYRVFKKEAKSEDHGVGGEIKKVIASGALGTLALRVCYTGCLSDR